MQMRNIRGTRRSTRGQTCGKQAEQYDNQTGHAHHDSILAPADLTHPNRP